MLQIFYKELNNFFCSISGYVAIAFYIIIINSFLWIIPEFNILDSGFATLEVVFSYSPYVMIFLSSVITMHMICEERKSGTLELLLSTSFSSRKIVFAKFFASSILVIGVLLFSLINYLILWFITLPKGHLDSAVILGSYFGLLLLSVSFCALGLLVSSYCSSQLVAFTISLLLCLFFFKGLEEIKTLVRWSSYSLFIYKISMKYNYELLSRGVLDIKNIAFFLYFIVTCLWLSIKKIENCYK